MSTRHGDRFQTTSWSLVKAAGSADSLRAREALAALCEIYWPPIYAYVRRRGSGAEDARDLTQAFFTHLLEEQALQRVEEGVGRFRSFLLTSLKNFLNDELDRARALKRGAGKVPISLDADTAESGYSIQLAAGITPDLVFERRWAATVLARALDRLQAQAEQSEARWRFERLKTYLTGEQPAPSYRRVAAELQMSEEAVKMAVHRLRRRYGEVLRTVVRETVAREDEIDDELRHLISAVHG